MRQRTCAQSLELEVQPAAPYLLELHGDLPVRAPHDAASASKKQYKFFRKVLLTGDGELCAA